MITKTKIFDKIEFKIYPDLTKIESKLTKLFNKSKGYGLGRGPSGLLGSDELDYAICRAESIVSYLKYFRELKNNER